MGAGWLDENLDAASSQDEQALNLVVNGAERLASRDLQVSM